MLRRDGFRRDRFRRDGFSARRDSAKWAQIIEIDCPLIVNVYNKHMGGIDLLDSLLGQQKIKIRSRKWYLRIFYHLLDVTVVNSWLLHKRIIA